MGYFRIPVKTNSIYYPQECHLPTWNPLVCLTCCLQGENKIEKSLPDRQLGNHSWAAGEAESRWALSPASHCCRHGSCQHCFLLEASKPKYSIIVLLVKHNVNLTIKLGTEKFQNQISMLNWIFVRFSFSANDWWIGFCMSAPKSRIIILCYCLQYKKLAVTRDITSSSTRIYKEPENIISLCFPF